MHVGWRNTQMWVVHILLRILSMWNKDNPVTPRMKKLIREFVKQMKKEKFETGIMKMLASVIT